MRPTSTSQPRCLRAACRESGVQKRAIELAARRLARWRQSVSAPGSYEPGRALANHSQLGGITALATYALLASEIPSSEHHVAAAVAYLKSINTVGTYALGLRSQVLVSAQPRA